MGAPIGNKNALTHGKHARFDIGLLPKELKTIERYIYRFRRALEAATIAARGDIGILQAAAIQSSAKWERHSQLCLHWLRKRHATMTDADRLAYSREVARASSERDRCLRALKLDASHVNVLDALYGDALAAINQSTDDDATRAKPGGHDGDGDVDTWVDVAHAERTAEDDQSTASDRQSRGDSAEV